MEYSNFKKINQLTDKFGYSTRLSNLFSDITSVKPSNWLLESIDLAYLAPMSNEKSKSERLVSPILLEVLRAYSEKLSFFSGENLDIDPLNDLAGPCDFFFALQPPSLVLEAPIISLAEAKDEDLDWGLAQCAAQMYGAFLFNQQRNKQIPVLYGCATTGVEWQFIKFEDKCFYIDKKPYTDLPQILGVWHHIIQLFLKES